MFAPSYVLEDEPPELVHAPTTRSSQVLPAEHDRASGKVPITIITGCLGAGKTTLMNYILKERHGKRIAVILNEFGDSADIEKALTINQDGHEVEEWLELGNGCICCSVKDSGVNAIESLMERRGAFDYILLETSGLADPGNIAPLFWVDDGLGSSIYLDGTVTLVDAKNILRDLDEPAAAGLEPLDRHGPPVTTAHSQISHADVILLNKSDTVSGPQLAAVKARIQAINGLSTIHVTQHGRVPRLDGVVLDIRAYDGVESLATAAGGHSHLDRTVSTVSVRVPVLGDAQLAAVEGWIQRLLWDSALVPAVPAEGSDAPGGRLEVHRLKGRLALASGSVRMVQGVRDVFDMTAADEAGVQEGKLVLIGRGMAGWAWQASLDQALGASAP